MNEPLLKATLKVILDGQAALYATIMTQHTLSVDESTESYEGFVDEYKASTAQLILEALDAAQDSTS